VHWEKPVGAVVLAWLILELRILSDEQFRTARSSMLGMIDVKALYYPLTAQTNPRGSGAPNRELRGGRLRWNGSRWR
jgi:hypothetical protein